MLNEQALQISARGHALRCIVHLYMVYIFVARDGNLVKRVRLAPRRNFYSYQEEDRGDKKLKTEWIIDQDIVHKTAHQWKEFNWAFRAKLLLNNKVHDQ